MDLYTPIQGRLNSIIDPPVKADCIGTSNKINV